MVADAAGAHAGAANGWIFTYSLSSAAATGVQVFTVHPPPLLAVQRGHSTGEEEPETAARGGGRADAARQ